MTIKTIYVCVVAVPSQSERTARQSEPTALPSELTRSQGRLRARDRMPDADPFIAGLIRKLQDEVRADRTPRFTHPRLAEPNWAELIGEAPPPLGESPMDFELPEREEDWPLLRDMEYDD